MTRSEVPNLAHIHFCVPGESVRIGAACDESEQCEGRLPSGRVFSWLVQV